MCTYSWPSYRPLIYFQRAGMQTADIRTFLLAPCLSLNSGFHVYLSFRLSKRKLKIFGSCDSRTCANQLNWRATFGITGAIVLSPSRSAKHRTKQDVLIETASNRQQMIPLGFPLWLVVVMPMCCYETTIFAAADKRQNLTSRHVRLLQYVLH